MTTDKMTYTSGAEIAEVINIIDPVIVGQPNHLVQLACLAIAIMVEDENRVLKSQGMADALTGASEWIHKFVASASPEQMNLNADTSGLPPEKIN